MELLCAFLTAFFTWVLILRTGFKRRARFREEAGSLLLAVRVSRRTRRIAYSLRWCIFAALLGGFLILASMVHRLDARSSGLTLLKFSDLLWSYCFLDCAILGWSLLVLAIATPPYWLRIALQVREHGVILRGHEFRQWAEIGQFRWFAPKTILGFLSFCWRPWPHSRYRLIISESDFGADQREAVTAALARFVAVYDHDGTLLAAPSQTEITARALHPVEKRPRFRFQFDLQALLLFVVVVSCAASCYAIHHRRAQPYRSAVTRLAAFQPDVHSLGEIPTIIDFSRSPTKPTDDDLACLECLDQLKLLDLTGSSVTDAGLEHLKKLPHLRSVMLIDTKVTRRGAEQLSRDLPQTTIFYGPRKKPVGLNVPDWI
jgi:hypothetical protein